MPPVGITMLPGPFLRHTAPETHPGAAQADTAFVAFAHRTGITGGDQDAALLRSFAFGVFTGWCYPTLTQSQLDLLTQWHYMFTITDDVADAADQGGPDEATDLRTAILGAIAAGSPPRTGGPAAVAFHDLWRRTAPQQSPHWRHRAHASLAHYLHQYTGQRRNRAVDHHFTPEEYIRLRRNSVGLDPNTDILEAVHSITIPEPVFASWEFRELRNCFVDANAWTNDYYSFDREVQAGEPHNLALVLAAHNTIGHDEALDRLLAMIQNRLRQFLTVEASLPDAVHGLGYDDNAVAETLRYATMLRDYTYGHVAWSSTSSRYNEKQLRATNWA